jgi:hypothetical protein
MIEVVLGIGLVAAAFMAVAFVRIRGGCGADCGACDRACAVQDPNALLEPDPVRDLDPLPGPNTLESEHGRNERG